MGKVDPMVFVAIMLRRRKKNRQWIHSTNKKRDYCGEYWLLVQELRLDEKRFHEYFRMSKESFDNLLSKIGPAIQRKGSNFRQALSPAQRLAITIR